MLNIVLVPYYPSRPQLKETRLLSSFILSIFEWVEHICLLNGQCHRYCHIKVVRRPYLWFPPTPKNLTCMALLAYHFPWIQLYNCVDTLCIHTWNPPCYHIHLQVGGWVVWPEHFLFYFVGSSATSSICMASWYNIFPWNYTFIYTNFLTICQWELEIHNDTISGFIFGDVFSDFSQYLDTSQPLKVKVRVYTTVWNN